MTHDGDPSLKDETGMNAEAEPSAAEVESHAAAPQNPQNPGDAGPASEAGRAPRPTPVTGEIMGLAARGSLARLLPFDANHDMPSFKKPGGFFVRHRQAVVLVAGAACLAAIIAAVPSRQAKISVADVRSIAKAPDPDRQIADMASEIKTLTENVNAMRGKIEVMRSETATMDTSVSAVRTSIDRAHAPDEIRALRKSVDALKQGFDQIKASSTTASGQASQALDRASHDSSVKLGQIAERLDHLEQDQVTKFALVTTRFDRIERRPASADITGSIPKQTAISRPPVPLPPPSPKSLVVPPKIAAILPKTAAAPPKTAAAPPKTAAAPPKTAAAPPRIPGVPPKITAAPKSAGLPGFTVRDAHDGIALVQGREGLFETGPGDYIPGVGEVVSVERRGRDWVVVTSRGTIEPARR